MDSTLFYPITSEHWKQMPRTVWAIGQMVLVYGFEVRIIVNGLDAVLSVNDPWNSNVVRVGISDLFHDLNKGVKPVDDIDRLFYLKIEYLMVHNLKLELERYGQ